MRFVLMGIVVLAAIALIGWLFHRFLCCLEDAGYLYYRKEKGGGSGVAGAFMELDHLTRPSMQHVVEAKDEVIFQRDDDGDGEE